MSQSGEREEGLPPPAPGVSGDTSQPERPPKQERPPSPATSSVPGQSDCSMDRPIGFSQQEPTTLTRPHKQERPPILATSSVSGLSDWSMDRPIGFSQPVSTMPRPPKQERPPSPATNSVSGLSDWSMDRPIGFSQPVSTMPRLSGCLITENGCALLASALQSNPSYLRELDLSYNHPEDPTFRLEMLRVDHAEKRGLDSDSETSNLAAEFYCDFKRKLKARNMTEPRSEIKPKLYITKTDGRFKKLLKQFNSRGKKKSSLPMEYEELFTSDNCRTLLTTGAAPLRATAASQAFIDDWASGKTNAGLKCVFSIGFQALNELKGNYSLMDLIHHFFEDTKESGISTFDQKHFLFVLDDLAECALPLDFKKNEVLTDVEEATSVDVLLTNLIKKKLLPSAHLWRVTLFDPSAVTRYRCSVDGEIKNKAFAYANEVVMKCMRDLKQSVRRRFQPVAEAVSKQTDTAVWDQVHTEFFLTKERSAAGRNEEWNYIDIFKPSSEQDEPIRTVLTTGQAGVGKTLCTQMFMLNWAEEKGDQDLLFIFHFTFSELNTKKGEKCSFEDLVKTFIKETQTSRFRSFIGFRILFILDGLNECQLELQFDNPEILEDVKEVASVDMLLTNLIMGNLLPTALLWITSRPGETNQILFDRVDRATKIQEKPDRKLQRKLKAKLERRYQRVFEGICAGNNSALLKKIFTELYITERQSDRVSDMSAMKGKTVSYRDIFHQSTPEPAVRRVLTQGVAGVGKTIASQKFMLDWAEGKGDRAIQDVKFIFPLPFRELNLERDKEFSLIGLLHRFFTEAKESEIDYSQHTVLFVLDGLDECKPPLNFRDNVDCHDVTKPASVNELLTSLLKGALLPTARLWVTARHGTAKEILDHVDMVTEVQGFNDSQKGDYFVNRFTDEAMAERIVSHVKKSRSLHYMCQIPVFCWIISTVLERILTAMDGETSSAESSEGLSSEVTPDQTNLTIELPKTQTEMYTHFLLFQSMQRKEKFHVGELNDTHWQMSKKTILSLGELAFQQLERGDLIFSESDLTECGSTLEESLVYSGLLTEVVRDDPGMGREKQCSFVHLSIQEFLAALHVLCTSSPGTGAPPGPEVYIQNVDRALQSEHGDWDMFLRFLLGLSLERNQELLHGLISFTGSCSQTNKQTAKHIKMKIREGSYSDRTCNLFYCLNELGDRSLETEIQQALRSGKLSDLSEAQWSALVFVLLTSEQKLDVFELKKYRASDEGLWRLLPVIRNATTALLSWCHLTEGCCETLASLLSSDSCKLTELDLSNNDLKDTGVKLLCGGLSSSTCKLKTLRLLGCQVSEPGCVNLASALRHNPSHVTELDLRYNHPGPSGVKLLSALREDPHCALESLRVSDGEPWRLREGLEKYACVLTLDPNTANYKLCLQGSRATRVRARQQYPRHLDRFDYRPVVLCQEALTGLCYWEVQWTRGAGIGVAHKGIGRKFGRHPRDSGLGSNGKSWSLVCSEEKFTAWHDGSCRHVPGRRPGPGGRVAVSLHCPAGTLSFYSVSSSGAPELLHTFRSSFTEPLYAGFWLGQAGPGSSVSVAQLWR